MQFKTIRKVLVNFPFNEGMTLPTAIAAADSKGVFSIGAVNGFGNYVSFSSQGNDFQEVIKPRMNIFP